MADFAAWRDRLRFRRGAPRTLSSLILPALAGLILCYEFVFGGSSGCAEVKPGEVAVIYNNTGVGLFGPEALAVTDQGVQTFIPGFQSMEKLERRPQILIMADDDTPKRKSLGDELYDPRSDQEASTQRVRALTVRASDGSNFYFDHLEIHYQLLPAQASKVIDRLGPGSTYKKLLVSTYARGVLRNEFGRFSFLEIADPTTYGAATADARNKLNQMLELYGIEIIQIVTPKPKFDARVETAIEERQNAEQEIEVQAEKRRKLEQEAGLKVQSIEQEKNAEYQTLIAEFEAQKKGAENKLLSVRREADKYFIERQSNAEAYRAEKITRAKANEEAYRKQAEALVAKISAVGDQGPDVLNRVIAEKVFPQLKRVRASPRLPPSTPIELRHLTTPPAGASP